MDKAKMRPALLILPISFLCTVLFSPGIVCAPGEKPANKILIEKKARRLTLLRDSVVIRNFHIALGGNPEGPKTCQGDQRTPEGKYVVSGRNKKSQYHWSLRISYPNEADKAAARRLKCNPGGDIFIHGLPNGKGWIGKAHALHDWTLGCIAVTDQEIEDIWNLVPNGTAVEIRP
jgi:murein L,D-transpeptidase YafK